MIINKILVILFNNYYLFSDYCVVGIVKNKLHVMYERYVYNLNN